MNFWWGFRWGSRRSARATQGQCHLLAVEACDDHSLLVTLWFGFLLDLLPPSDRRSIVVGIVPISALCHTLHLPILGRRMVLCKSKHPQQAGTCRGWSRRGDVHKASVFSPSHGGPAGRSCYCGKQNTGATGGYSWMDVPWALVLESWRIQNQKYVMFKNCLILDWWLLDFRYGIPLIIFSTTGASY